VTVLDRVQVCERGGEDVTVAGPFRVFCSVTPLRDERLDLAFGPMSTLGAQSRSEFDVHLS
jgi:hypothetical protein